MADFQMYKECSIEKLEHPKLIGKYEVWEDDGETFIGRFQTIKECKQEIDEIQEERT